MVHENIYLFICNKLIDYVKLILKYFFSLLPAKMCWELMHRIIKGPQVMMDFKGRPKVAAG